MAATGTVAVAGCSTGGGNADEDGTDTGNDEATYEGLRIDGQRMNANFPMEIYTVSSEERVGQIHWHDGSGEWHLAPLKVPVRERQLYDLRIRSPDGEEIPTGNGAQFQFEAEPTEDTSTDLVTVETFNAIAAIEGQRTGLGGLVFYIVSDGERIWRSPPLRIEVASET